MRELIADLFISLDGFASGTDEPAYFGYDGPDLSSWVLAELNQPHVLLMGRNTYSVLSEVAAAATDPVSARMRELPKLVFSSTLKGPLKWNNTQVIAGDLAQQIHALKQQPGDTIRSIGSIQLVQGMLELGLIDRLRLMIFPLMLGDTGQEPIHAGLRRTALHLVATKVLDSRLVLLEYGPQNRVGSA
jgi:dihydrofolate reductase